MEAVNACRLEVTDLSVGYSRRPILNAITFHPPVGKISVILGPNGSGKSTLIKTVAGLLSPWSGTVTLDGVSIGGVGADVLARQGICLIPQGNALFPFLSVREHLELYAAVLLSKKRVQEALEEAYEMFPLLKEKREVIANRLSGGQRAVLALSKAFLLKPRLVLLDEPSIGLSPKVAREIYSHVGRLRQDGVTTVVVEQNVQIALPYADEVLLMAQGRREFEGTPEAMEESGEMYRVFFGREKKTSGGR